MNVKFQKIVSGERHVAASGDDDAGLSGFCPAKEYGNVLGIDVDAAVTHPVDASFVQCVSVTGKEDAVIHIVDAGGVGVVFRHVVTFFVEDRIDAGGSFEIIGSRSERSAPPDHSVTVHGIETSVTARLTYGDDDKFPAFEIRDSGFSIVIIDSEFCFAQRDDAFAPQSQPGDKKEKDDFFHKGISFADVRF